MWKVSGIILLFAICAALQKPGDVLEITLHVYSGKPDPVWTIHSDDPAYDILTRNINQLQSSQLASLSGYKGFTLILSRGAVPDTKTVTIGKCTNKAFETLIFDSIKQRVTDDPQAGISEGVKQHVSHQISGCP